MAIGTLTGSTYDAGLKNGVFAVCGVGKAIIGG